MKRKRKSAKHKPKKPSDAEAADVDPGYYSDTNAENDGIGSRIGTETREVNENASGQHLGSVFNNKSVGGGAARLAMMISSPGTNLASERAPLQHERIGEKEPKSSRQEPVYNKQDLDAARLVIKKIMQTDAAVPFNAPVDPIALGIPDYFDIIDSPMDFGTIYSKLESGLKYRNSEEVLKDVELIWDNCCKYNKKGSYIVELMKRVKSNFMKQWTAAGLNKEQQTVSNGHLPHNPQVLAESTMRREEVGHIDPIRSTISRSTNMQEHDWSQRQYQQPSHCCSHTFNPHPIFYPYQSPYHSGLLQPGLHQHDLVPQHNHFAHAHSVDLANGKCCSQWVNEAGPSLAPSCGPSPSFSRAYMHQPSSSQLPPYHLGAGINAQTAGHVHLAHGEPTLTSKKSERAFSSGRDTHNGYHSQQYQMDSSHVPAYHPSASCMPVHQLNQSALHQLHSSHVEGGRNTDFAGNLHIPPPTESTINCTKRGNKRFRPPITDNTSSEELNQKDSTPEQSSSMVNIKACQPLEKTFQNQPESSPSERVHSTADNNFSKRKTRSQGLVQSQEQSSSMMNSQEHQPQEDTCQGQDVSPQSRPSPPTTDYSIVLKRKSGGRGPNKEISVIEGERIPITTNGLGQPVGPNTQKFVTFLGKLARNGHLLPLTYLKWKSVPSENKEELWEKVQSRFDINPTSKDWVLQSLNDKWRAWRSRLKIAHYDPHITDEARLADRDERVLPEQWAALIKLWKTESIQKQSARNRANRMQQKYIHASGRKSFAQIREEQRAIRPDGKEPSREELFILTRLRKNGQPINQASAEAIMRIRNRAKEQDTTQDNTKQHDVLSDIIGPDKKGRVRCVELGPSPYLNPTRTEAIKMVTEASSEIQEMKEKMAFMERTCAQMASQMAAMMSMMSSMHKNGPDENQPNIAANTSDHSVPELAAHSKQTSQEGSTRQTRRSKKICRV